MSGLNGLFRFALGAAARMLTRRVMSGARGRINAGTQYCGVYGHPVKHSASPAMHNAALEALGLEWRCVPAWLLSTATELPEAGNGA